MPCCGQIQSQVVGEPRFPRFALVPVFPAHRHGDALLLPRWQRSRRHAPSDPQSDAHGSDILAGDQHGIDGDTAWAVAAAALGIVGHGLDRQAAPAAKALKPVGIA